MNQLPRPSECGTHHVSQDGTRTHEKEFTWVLPFHKPGLAPVGDGTGAYHIRLNGKPAYSSRFDRTFGFYFGLAAVCQNDHWWHINATGERISHTTWSWCGNFQQNRCTVRDFNGGYYHLKPDGQPVQGGPYAYAGDFREGAAVVRGMDGLCHHITLDGEKLHSNHFLDLDVFHKGIARAKDSNGWHHIDKNGNCLSNGVRYLEIEPFYNGQAIVKTLDGRRIIINENGSILVAIPSSIEERVEKLSQFIVGYWPSITMRLGILAGLTPRKPMLNISKDDLNILKGAWVELGLLDDKFTLTPLGETLATSDSLVDRVLYWTGPQFTPWVEAEKRLTDSVNRTDFFSFHSQNKDLVDLIHRVLDSYATSDWMGINDVIAISDGATIIDLGGGKGALLEEFNNHRGERILVDRSEVLNGIQTQGLQLHPCDMFTQPLPLGDIYFLSRILHDWDDAKSTRLLSKIPDAATVYVIDRVNEGHRHGLLSLNMLLTTGGKERTLKQWEALFSSVDYTIDRQIEWNEHTIFELKRC